MSRANAIVLPRLRRYRRPFGWVVAALLVVPLANMLGQCLVMDARAASQVAPVSERMPASDEMPCADCSLGGDWRSLDGTGTALSGGPKPWFVFALFVASALLALAFPKSIALPPRPPLPSRPRALKFCVLRL